MNLEVEIQKLSPGPGDLLVVQVHGEDVSEDTVDEVYAAMQALDLPAQVLIFFGGLDFSTVTEEQMLRLGYAKVREGALN